MWNDRAKLTPKLCPYILRSFVLSDSEDLKLQSVGRVVPSASPDLIVDKIKAEASSFSYQLKASQVCHPSYFRQSVFIV